VDNFSEEEREEVEVPADLRERVEQALKERPERAWDIALIGLLPDDDEDEAS
jgi:hypothetical protein